MLSLDLALFAVGVIVVIKGADYFTDGAICLARVTGISEVIIGATVVSLATTLPEFSVSTYAALKGHTDMAAGNALGSVLFNTGLIFGGSVLARGFLTDRRLFRQEGGFMLGAAVLTLAMGLDGTITRGEGGILLAVFVLYMAVATFNAVAQSRASEVAAGDDSWAKPALRGSTGLFVLGGLMVAFGSRLLVNSGISIAVTLGVSEMFLGLTLVAAGTSLPELVTAVVALAKGHQALSVGNILGANFLNLTWVMGMAAVVRGVPFSTVTTGLDLPAVLVSLVMLLWFARTTERLDRWEGGVLLGTYVLYVAYRGISLL
ncbi:MAG: calcium/sodium antiporter [Bacillota bacterium]|jgi:cation:H+ antiporter